MPVHPNSIANLEKGKRFSKTYKPANTGRRRDYLKEFIDDNKVSLNDLKAILENVLGDHSFADLEKILARGQKTLPAFVAAYIKGMITDLKKGRTDTVDKMWDRIHGKANQTSVLEVYDISDDAKKRMSSIFNSMLKDGTEIKPANLLEQEDIEPEKEEG